ncbi:ABC transporter ATP-binding protein [Paenibacillus thalictri]|uniref:ABC transporter ATP-binding protein n=1 Tax=Paenibacillus thalictri TaxID=2527873 RepID=A0A4Q9E0L2_9BACL|nr:ABC transporter ATP-binding protein [Paenibacillus thalictri]TBL81673.1 ABC transporter ATP-binding protein [Paenibacillus thalictri]
MGTLVLKNVSKKYKDSTAVNNVNVTINRNEFVTIVGPSGCGKTTTLRMIAGFIEPTDGIIRLDEDELVNTASSKFLPPEKRGIGMVFQSYAVWPHMNVFDNVAYPLKLRKLSKSVIAEKTKEILRIVHLAQYETRFPHELSGGQQQRVALARALVMEPRLLLLDEPLSNLDAALREQMRVEIKEIQRKMGITIVNVTHDQIEAMTMSDKVIVMNAGNVIQVGSPQEIYNKPADSFVAKFIGSANVLPCTRVGNAADGKMKVSIFGSTVDIAAVESSRETGFISVRPHHITLDRTSSLKGKIVNKLYQGDRIEYQLTLHNEKISVVTDASEEHNYELEDELGVTIRQGVWLHQ